MLYRLIIRKLLTKQPRISYKNASQSENIVKLAVTIETIGGATRTRTPNQYCAKCSLCFIDISSHRYSQGIPNKEDNVDCNKEYVLRYTATDSSRYSNT